MIDLDKILCEPKIDFLKTTLRFVGHLEEIDFGLVMVIEIISDDMLEFGIGTSADVTSNAVVVFIHDEEDIGAVEVFPEAFISAEEAFGVGAVAFGERLAGVEARNRAVFDGIVNGVRIILKNGSRPINDRITATFEIAPPVDGTFVEFGATTNNEFFHN